MNNYRAMKAHNRELKNRREIRGGSVFQFSISMHSIKLFYCTSWAMKVNVLKLQKMAQKKAGSLNPAR